MMKIQLVCRGEDCPPVWFQAVLNGRDFGLSVPIGSIGQFQAIEDRMTRLVNDAYERGFEDGEKAAKLAIRTAMGF